MWDCYRSCKHFALGITTFYLKKQITMVLEASQKTGSYPI